MTEVIGAKESLKTAQGIALQVLRLTILCPRKVRPFSVRIVGVHYETENEVNSNFWAGSLTDYLRLLETSHRAIKAVDPDARVLPSAMACGVIFNPKTQVASERRTSVQGFAVLGAFEPRNAARCAATCACFRCRTA
jgi:hypothetical protein